MDLFAQFVGAAWDIKSIVYWLILIIGCVCVLGVVYKVSGVQEYLNKLPDWVWKIGGLVILIVVALWAIRTFF
jgi:hypothetical protein